jgi:hypothetical protein
MERAFRGPSFSHDLSLENAARWRRFAGVRRLPWLSGTRSSSTTAATQIFSNWIEPGAAMNPKVTLSTVAVNGQ